MSIDECFIEAAEAVVQAETDGAIARLRHGLAEPGETDCIDCGEPIGAARREALPSARRCIGCQHVHELRGSRA